MKSKIFLFLFSTVLLLESCQKNVEPATSAESASSERTVDILLNHYNFIHQRTDAYMSIGTYATLPTQSQDDKSLTANAATKSANDVLQSASIGGFNLSLDANAVNGLINNDYLGLKSVYGTNASFNFTDAGGIVRAKSLYIPKSLNLSVNSEQLDNLDLRAGTVINWNKDINNVKGVVFIFAYDPFHSPSTKEAYPKRISKAVGNSDTGTYTLKQSDIDGLPKGGRIKMTVGRAGFEIFQPENSLKTYSLYGYTLVDAMGIIK